MHAFLFDLSNKKKHAIYQIYLINQIKRITFFPIYWEFALINCLPFLIIKFNYKREIKKGLSNLFDKSNKKSFLNFLI